MLVYYNDRMNTGRLGVRLLCDPPGVIESPARPDPHVVIHVGPSVEIRCERGDKAHTGVSVHGDVDIIPAGMRSRWILTSKKTLRAGGAGFGGI